MNLSLKTLSSWTTLSLVGLAGVSTQSYSQGVISYSTQAYKVNEATQQADVNRKAAILYVDYDNIVGQGDFKTKFQNNFGQFLLTLKALHYPEVDLNVNVYGNFAYHFQSEPNEKGERMLDAEAFEVWKDTLPTWCQLRDTPTRKSKGPTHGKTCADAMIMFGLQHDAFMGHSVALMSNDVDFDHHLKLLKEHAPSVDLFTNKLCHYDLKSALPDYIDAREIMLQSGLSSVDMALSELSTLGRSFSYAILRAHFEFYSQNDWQGTGSFQKFLTVLAPMLDFNFREQGKIHVGPALNTPTHLFDQLA